ncbi:MAG: hypothetical protein C4554_04050 [Dethiobacter sp.]|jgi:hypothetical protein|nr:MAG: hypothetical protein C4554_04050 [Dethiobacter sp.]
MKGWVLLTIKYDPVTASLLEGRLKEDNIPVVMKREAAGSIYSLTTGPLAEIEIYVPHSKLKEARMLLDKIEGDNNC